MEATAQLREREVQRVEGRARWGHLGTPRPLQASGQGTSTAMACRPSPMAGFRLKGPPGGAGVTGTLRPALCPGPGSCSGACWGCGHGRWS